MSRYDDQYVISITSAAVVSVALSRAWDAVMPVAQGSIILTAAIITLVYNQPRIHSKATHYDDNLEQEHKKRLIWHFCRPKS